MLSRISQYLETRTHHSPTHASVEDCPQGMHQDLIFIPRKGTRRGLASRGKVLVQLAALPAGFIEQGLLKPCSLLVSNEDLACNTTSLLKTFRDPAGM